MHIAVDMLPEMPGINDYADSKNRSAIKNYQQITRKEHAHIMLEIEYKQMTVYNYR